jgi:Na+/phosphate symporter
MKRSSKPPVVLLTVAFTSLLFALTQLKDALRTYQIKDAEYRFNMTLFIIFLCISFFLVGIYFGIWWIKSKQPTPPPRQRTQKA